MQLTSDANFDRIDNFNDLKLSPSCFLSVKLHYSHIIRALREMDSPAGKELELKWHFFMKKMNLHHYSCPHTSNLIETNMRPGQLQILRDYQSDMGSVLSMITGNFHFIVREINQMFKQFPRYRESSVEDRKFLGDRLRYYYITMCQNFGTYLATHANIRLLNKIDVYTINGFWERFKKDFYILNNLREKFRFGDRYFSRFFQATEETARKLPRTKIANMKSIILDQTYAKLYDIDCTILMQPASTAIPEHVMEMVIESLNHLLDVQFFPIFSMKPSDLNWNIKEGRSTAKLLAYCIEDFFCKSVFTRIENIDYWPLEDLYNERAETRHEREMEGLMALSSSESSGECGYKISGCGVIVTVQ